MPIESKKTDEDFMEENSFEVKVVSKNAKLNLNMQIIAKETEKNYFLNQLRKYILNGWNLSHIGTFRV
jgi:hypothetical protein